MSNFLKHYETSALIDAIESNAFILPSLMRYFTDSNVYDDADLLRIITTIPYPLFNGVMRARLDADNVEACIEETISIARQNKVPVLWHIGPGTYPSSLDKSLLKHEFSPVGSFPGMAVDLVTIKDTQLIHAEAQVKEIVDRSELRTWSQIMQQGFEMPIFAGDAIFELLSKLESKLKIKIHNYIGRLSGEPVATATMVLGSGVAGIYNVATLHGARKQGLGTAMTVKPLIAAREMGYRFGVLQSAEEGLGIYKRIGFREYCQFRRFVWNQDLER